MKKRRKKKKKNIFNFVLIILLLFAFIYIKKINTNVGTIIDDGIKEIEELRKTEENKKLYEECLEEKYDSSNSSEEIEELFNELSNYLKKYSCSVGYFEPGYGYGYVYNESKVYYAASTIKMLDAIYIYDKATSGEINLDDTVTYKEEYRLGDSAEMKKHKYGDKVTLRNLVKYAITVSDNTAHEMLVAYIGKSELKSYGKSMGAKYTLFGDEFGEITVSDALIYLGKLYELINSSIYGDELLTYFVNSDQNYLTLEGIDAATKYGEYSYYFHENGIVYSTNPYFVSILTLEGVNEKTIRDINEHVYNLHTKLYELKKDMCYKKVYEK